MELQRLIPMLRTANLKATVEFYTTVAGFECNALNEEWGWASLQRDEVTIMVALPNAPAPFENP